jgi:predicted phosphohydrolase
VPKLEKGLTSQAMARFWFISDTHGRHEKLIVPPGIDCVIHCGDEANRRQPELNLRESEAFFAWFDALPIAQKIFVPGNHSIAIEQGLLLPARYPDITFLIHAATTWKQFTLFGSPYTPNFHNWAYMREREALAPLWASIPEGLDILITHSPPYGFRDQCTNLETPSPTSVGCQALRRHCLERIRPRLHAFGHIHDESAARNFGWTDLPGIRLLNCSCVNRHGRLVNHGITLELQPQEEPV